MLQASLLVEIFFYIEKGNVYDIKIIIFIPFIDPPSELWVVSSLTPPLSMSVQSWFVIWPDGFNQIKKIV